MLEEINESYEDYLKTIFQLSKIKKGGLCSNSDISKFLNVKPASVTGMLYNLRDHGFIRWKPRKFVGLTKEGRKIAQSTINNYNVLKNFFIQVIKLNDKTLIDKLCCGIEHHITSEISKTIQELIESQDF